jgi:hypothetical protein
VPAAFALTAWSAAAPRSEGSRGALHLLSTPPSSSQPALAGRGLLTTTPETAITFDKTVGLDPGVCATTDAIITGSFVEVVYCYFMTNTGDIALNLHDVVDSELGVLIGPAFPATVGPGGSAFFTVTAVITDTVVNTAVWTAYNAGPINQASATDTATVTVAPSSIEFTKTVGTDPGVCALLDAIVVVPGTEVTYCYSLQNTGLITVTLHDVVDSELGVLLGPMFPAVVVPGGGAFFTTTATINDTTVNTATWRVSNPGPDETVVDESSANDTALVSVVTLTPTATATPTPTATPTSTSTPGAPGLYEIPTLSGAGAAIFVLLLLAAAALMLARGRR